SIHPQGQKVFSEGVLPILNSGIFRQPISESLIRNANNFVQLGLTGYDACYAALAKDLGGCWLTFDKKAHQLIEKEEVSCFIYNSLPENWKKDPL
ncbi:MAG: hypothetical protein HOE30_18185, partial [Deltaproteobacteria bacterium]|nr:hypothetical protein [Deltaproteobacteria bacterium]